MTSSDIDYYDHPIFNPFELLILTPAMVDIEEYILRCLWNGSTGAVIRGEARIGKTTAFQNLGQRLRTRGDKTIPTHFFTVPMRDHPTITSLYRSLSVSANLRITNQSRVEPLLGNLISFFLDEVTRCKSKRLALFVDEGQRLSLPQCNVFAELQDFMRANYKILLSVFFVVNTDEAQNLLEDVQSGDHKHIYGRFFKQVRDYYGIRDRSEVEFCLQQYDQLRFPEETGPTYTEYFLPGSAKESLKLSNISSDLWRIFREYQKKYRLSSWGMAYFIPTVNLLLTDFLPEYGVEELSDEILREAIIISGLIPSLVKS